MSSTLKGRMAKIWTAKEVAEKDAHQEYASAMKRLQESVAAVSSAQSFTYMGQQTGVLGAMTPGNAFWQMPDYGGLSRAMIGQAQQTTGVAEKCEKPSMESLKRVALEVQTLDIADVRVGLAVEAESVLGYKRLREEVKAPKPTPLADTLARLEIEILDKDSVNAYKDQMKKHMAGEGMHDPTWVARELCNYSQPVPEFVLSKCIEIKKEVPQARFYVEQLQQDPFMYVSMPRHHEDVTEWYYIDVWDEPKFEGRA